MKHNSEMSDKVGKELKEWRVSFPSSKEKSWAGIQAKIQSATPVIKLKKRQPWRQIAIAASIVLALGLTFLLTNNATIEIQTANHETKEVILPDHSIVHINVASSISYNEDEWSENRLVHLKGEAYFEVEKGSYFSVVSDKGTVKVLGTGFNIYDRMDGYKVGCTHGKVSVKMGDDSVILTKGMYAEGRSDGLTSPQLMAHINDWTKGYIYFDEVNLVQVFDAIERQFDVKISHAIDGKRKFSGRFQLQSLQEALTVICEPMNLSFEVDESTDGNKVNIHNK